MTNKNYIEQIAKMLGVEIGERFNIIDEAGETFDDGPFVLKEKGLFDVEEFYSDILLTRLLNGTAIIQKQWKPKEDDIYYVPSPGEPALCKKFTWKDDEIDNHCYENNIICKTEAAAIILTERMLKIAGD